jgi:two-component system sensor histidine kinase DesK
LALEQLPTAPGDQVLEPRKWATGWRRLVFPGVFLVYLGQALQGVHRYSSGTWVVVGTLVLVVFAVCYLVAIRLCWGRPGRTFWVLYGVMLGLCAVEAVFAHQDAFVMLVFVAVLTISALGGRGVVIVLGLLLVATFLPAMIPSWDAGVDTDIAVSLLLVTFAMYGFFAVVKANRQLSEARGQVARLAAENERNRIARDLHDLLGHSLTTITVKAGLAHRLVATDPTRAAGEMAEVEELARRSLGDVRAAVTGYREVTLTGELATGSELLRAAGIAAQLPRATDVVAPEHHELFGWVVREGLTNVVRHSRATSCAITLGPSSIEIVDDGRGGSAAAANGLNGLRERVEAAGGTMTAGPRFPAGWRVRVTVPVGQDDHAAVPAAVDGSVTA